MKKLALHWKILIGMVLGVGFGFLMNSIDGGKEFVSDWVKPFGTIFINLLKLIAVPLILASLIKGISDLKDISKIKKMGLRTVIIYVMTTVIAITIGLGIVNVVKPGEGMSKATIEKIKSKYESSAGVKDKMMLGFLPLKENLNGFSLLIIIFAEEPNHGGPLSKQVQTDFFRNLKAE